MGSGERELRASLGDILQTAPTLDRDKQRIVADLLISKGADDYETLGVALIEEHGFTESEAAEATETLERGKIAVGHKEQNLVPGQPIGHPITQPSRLAALVIGFAALVIAINLYRRRRGRHRMPE